MRNIHPMKEKYEIVKYRPEFKNQIVELQTHLWSPDLAANTAYLEWKYEQNPYLDTPLIYLALYAGKVVGMRGMYGAKWEIGHPSQKLSVVCAGDSVTAPEHRKCGLYKRITKVALNDLDNIGYRYIFSLSTGPITLPSSLSMGWRSVGSLQTMIREARQRTVSSSKEQQSFSYLDRNVTERRLKVSPYVCLERTARTEAMAELVEQIGNDGRIRHARDQQYFAWRFKNPLSQYRFLYWEDSSLDGYLVLQMSVYRDRSRVRIADWEATNTQVRADLLQAAIYFVAFEALTIWSATLPDEAKMLLQNSGFTYLEEIESIKRHSFTILLRPVHDQMPKADWVLDNRRSLDLTNWDLRMIYSDGY
ncbi:MAG: hypothetical protein ACRENT_03785 [Thermodesulfobacteriota bacterium]